MFLNHTGKPSLYLPAATTLWGAITVLTGFTQNFTGVLITRFFLGFVEAAFFPGAFFLLSSWYRREELGVRLAILSSGNLISNAFGGLLAAGILSSMEGILGYAGWRWLFFIEGLVTIFVAVCSIFILPDFPSNTQWLSPLERRLAEVRIAEDVGVVVEAGEKMSQMQGLKMAVADWKVWWLALTFTVFNIGTSFFAYFPTLTATLGYSPTVTLLLCAPPWIFAALCAFINARHSDKTKERFFHSTIPIMIGIFGLFIALATMNTTARYVALFLMVQSNVGCIVLLSWTSNSIPNPPAKRAVALALVGMISQIANIVGSYMFPTSWGPTYRKSYTICIAGFAICILMSLILRQHLISLNKRMDKEENRGYGVGPVDGLDEEMLDGVGLLSGRLSRSEDSFDVNGKVITERRGFRFLY